MKIIDIGNDKAQITATNGVIDIRNNQIYAVVICKHNLIKYFIENV